MNRITTVTMQLSISELTL